MSTIDFEHRHAAHCESGVISSMLRHHGASVSEPMAFGLSAALAFAYLPFIRLSGMPLIAYRQPPRAIVRALRKPFAARLRFEKFSSVAAGEGRVDELLAQGHVLGLQTSVYWLPYFPPDMRFHFNGHNLLIYGREGDEYLVSDPVTEHAVRCPVADMNRARFAKGVLAPKGLLYYVEALGRHTPPPEDVRAAIAKAARNMLAPVPLIGVRGMRSLARRIDKLDAADPHSALFIGHLVRMQEEIGTGGAGFRFLYAAFLQEAAELLQRPTLNEFAERLLIIGDGWRELALQAARMLRGRTTLEPRLIGDLLRRQAEDEALFFRQLKASVA